jgi:hypothetical protein
MVAKERESAVYVKFESQTAKALLMAARIAEALDSQSLPMRDIYALFARSESAAHIHEALGILDRAGLADRVKVETGGRPAEVWSAV